MLEWPVQPKGQHDIVLTVSTQFVEQACHGGVSFLWLLEEGKVVRGWL